MKINLVPLMVFVGVAGLIFLYFYNPEKIGFFPRCPFFVLTGFKCPGCGSMRAVHALLHLRFADAFMLNPLMIVSIPVMLLIVFSRKIRYSVFFAWSVAIVVVAYWILRNVVDFFPERF